MPEIVISTLNARYSHASFGLRYLLANMGELQERTGMLEFEIKQSPDFVADQLLKLNPRIIGLGVYIWNVTPLTQVVRTLRARRPDVTIVLGGPEVSFEIEQQEICSLADYVVTGEADLTFPKLCREILGGAACPQDAALKASALGATRSTKVVQSPPPNVTQLTLPYYLYDEKDIAHRVIYVEASRGCPFTCEFCLSSLDVPLRRVPLETLLPAFDDLLSRGVSVFKFVDRTFNLSIPYSLKLLEFFLERYEPGLFLHFEMIPDRLPEPLREIIKAFPRGAMQFEVGIQTFNTAVAALIKRRQDYVKTEDNIRWLLAETGSYIHADLIVGLPGESWESFAAGFDRLVALGPQEIQVNLLKRLRGTPIVRHDEEWKMVYATEAPYEIMSNRLLDVPAMVRLRHFGKFWDLISNSGNFIETTPTIWAGASPFFRMMELSDRLFSTLGRSHGIPLEELAHEVFHYLVANGADARDAAQTMARDLQRGADRDIPTFLRPHLDNPDFRAAFRQQPLKLKRQARRFAAGRSEQ